MSDLNPSLMIGSTIIGAITLSSIIPIAYILLYFIIGRNKDNNQKGIDGIGGIGGIRYLLQFLNPLTKHEQWQIASKKMAKVLYGSKSESNVQVQFIGSLIGFVVIVYTYASIVAGRKIAGCQDKDRTWLTIATTISNNFFIFTLIALAYYIFANNFKTAIGYKSEAIKNITGLIVFNIILILIRMYLKVMEYKIDRSELRPWYKRWTIDLVPFINSSPFMSALYVPILTIVGYQLMKMYYNGTSVPGTDMISVSWKGFILYLIIMAMGLSISFSMPYMDAYLKNVGGAFSLCRQSS